MREGKGLSPFMLSRKAPSTRLFNLGMSLHELWLGNVLAPVWRIQRNINRAENFPGKARANV